MKDNGYFIKITKIETQKQKLKYTSFNRTHHMKNYWKIASHYLAGTILEQSYGNFYKTRNINMKTKTNIILITSLNSSYKSRYNILV